MKKKLALTAMMITVLLGISGCGLFDKEPPVMRLTQGDGVIIDVHTPFHLKEYVEAMDNHAGYVPVVTDERIDMRAIGKHTLTVYATDERGNRGEIALTVQVVDREKPEVKLIGDDYVEVALNSTYEDAGAEAIDNYDTVLKTAVVGQVDTSTLGEYKLLYRATDGSGNVGKVQRRVVVKDMTPPEVTLIGEASVVLPFGTSYEEPGFEAKDNVKGHLERTIEGEVEIYKSGDYTLTYKATDAYGNVGVATRTITVEPMSTKDRRGVHWKVHSISTNPKDVLHEGSTFTMMMTVDNQSKKTIQAMPFMNFTDDNGFLILKMQDLGYASEFAGAMPPGVAYDFKMDVIYDGDLARIKNVTQIRYDFSETTTSMGMTGILKVDFKAILEEEGH